VEIAPILFLQTCVRGEVAAIAGNGGNSAALGLSGVLEQAANNAKAAAQNSSRLKTKVQ
jgi:hypothetical protein